MSSNALDTAREAASFQIAAASLSRIKIAFVKKKLPYSQREGSSLIGCSASDLVAHLERQFLPGMSWENYGKHGWHMDHLVPILSVNWDDSEDVKRIFNYKNIHPMWAKDHTSKTISDRGHSRVPESVFAARKARKEARVRYFDRVIGLATQGYSYHRIARILDMHTSTVARMGKEYINNSMDTSKPVQAS